MNRHFSKEMTYRHVQYCYHQKNENQNYQEILPHICQNDYHQKSTNNKYQQGSGEKGALPPCWWEYKMI